VSSHPEQVPEHSPLEQAPDDEPPLDEEVLLDDDAGSRLLAAAVEKLGISARSYAAVLRVARTIADLDGSEAVRAPDVAEAVHARILDRQTR
jgi:magnesium chelatase family protein